MLLMSRHKEQYLIVLLMPLDFLRYDTRRFFRLRDIITMRHDNADSATAASLSLFRRCRYAATRCFFLHSFISLSFFRLIFADCYFALAIDAPAHAFDAAACFSLIMPSER